MIHDYMYYILYRLNLSNVGSLHPVYFGWSCNFRHTQTPIHTLSALGTLISLPPHLASPSGFPALHVSASPSTSGSYPARLIVKNYRVAGAGGCIDHTIATPTGAGTDPTKLGSPGRGVAVSPGPPLGLGPRPLARHLSQLHVCKFLPERRSCLVN